MQLLTPQTEFSWNFVSSPSVRQAPDNFYGASNAIDNIQFVSHSLVSYSMNIYIIRAPRMHRTHITNRIHMEFCGFSQCPARSRQFLWCIKCHWCLIQFICHIIGILFHCYFILSERLKCRLRTSHTEFSSSFLSSPNVRQLPGNHYVAINAIDILFNLCFISLIFYFIGILFHPNAQNATYPHHKQNSHWVLCFHPTSGKPSVSYIIDTFLHLTTQNANYLSSSFVSSPNVWQGPNNLYGASNVIGILFNLYLIRFVYYFMGILIQWYFNSLVFYLIGILFCWYLILLIPYFICILFHGYLIAWVSFACIIFCMYFLLHVVSSACKIFYMQYLLNVISFACIIFCM